MTSRRTLTWTRLVAALTLVSLFAPQLFIPAGTRAGLGVLYVTPGGTGDCSAWAHACTLSSALSEAIYGDEVWVAAGTYTPDTSGLTDPRTASFQLKLGVALYGGFTGTEMSIDQRNWVANVTILSGDLNGDDSSNFANNGDNSYHVVTSASETDWTTRLDGFTVTAGNADGGVESSNSGGGGIYLAHCSPTLTNLTITGNSGNYFGAGVYNFDSHPTLTNVTLSNNSAAYYGGGMYNQLSAPVLYDATFSHNSAGLNGGGMVNDTGGAVLTNVTFYGNTADEAGGGMLNGSLVTLTNVTVSGNSAVTGGGMANANDAQVTVRNSIFWGNQGGQIVPNASAFVSYSDIQNVDGGDGNIDADPLLGPLGTYGGVTQTLPLLPGSPAIDAGNDAVCAEAEPYGPYNFDQRGVARPQGSHCDIGAYEARPFTLSPTAGDNQTTLVDTAFAQPLVVSVTGTAGDPVAGGQITFTAPTSGASAMLAGSPATVDSSGTASVTATANGDSGTYQVQAGTRGAEPTTFALTNAVPDVTPPVITVPGDMTVDATSPDGAVVTYTATATDNVDGNVPVTCTPPSGSTFPTGDTTVTCTARDAAGNEATASFAITVLGATQQLAALNDTVKRLDLSVGVENSLERPLENAQVALSSGTTTQDAAACNQMDAFIRIVLAQSGRALTPAQATDLIASARRIQAVIGCD